MTAPSPVVLCVTIGVVVFVVGGSIARYRWSPTRYQIPLLGLIFLTVTAGLTGAVGAFLTAWDAEKIDYRTEITPQRCENDSVHEYEAVEYSELSPDAQEVFRSALQADDTHTTSTNPDEFRLQTDAGGTNYIVYNSNCYALRAEQRGDFATGFVMLFYLTAGFLTTVVLLMAIIASLTLGPVKIPTAVLAGLGSAGGLVVSGITQFRQLAGATVVIGVLAWIVLRVVELRSDERFQERIET